ncbi:MAG: ATP phosphoribosyltransferase regulatory subunit, partial [Myxococcales bacterium]|nr:ATP phosphoribosyltransferase regulatory subunit [Myxococcales bacterium]
WLDEDWPHGYHRHPLIDEGMGDLQALFGYLAAMGAPLDRVRAVPSLARGLEIYTGTVFEFFLPDSPIASSVAAGGRYDRIIGAFLANAKREGEEDVDLDKIPDYPACGISFGLDVVFQSMRLAAGQGAPRRSVARACVVPIGEPAAAVRIARSLRSAGIATEILAERRKLKKALAYIDKLQIPYAVLVGEEELARGVVKIRDMAGGTETEMPVDAAAGWLANGRAPKETK